MVTGKRKKPIDIDKKLIQIYIKQEGLCYYCGNFMHSPLQNPCNGKHKDNTPTIEHLYPKNDLRRRCIGGNLAVVVACSKCNSLKGSLDGKVTHAQYSRKETKPYKGLLIKLLKNEVIYDETGLSGNLLPMVV